MTRRSWWLGGLLVAAALVCGGATRPLPKDNSACLTCHVNFEHEPMVEAHLAKGIVCARCHGISYDHLNDEDAANKPDILFGRLQVVPFCRGCHAQHKNPAKVEQFRKDNFGKRRPNGRLIRENPICTDCHGEHRISKGK